jgi:hypothetical protein
MLSACPGDAENTSHGDTSCVAATASERSLSLDECCEHLASGTPSGPEQDVGCVIFLRVAMLSEPGRPTRIPGPVCRTPTAGMPTSAQPVHSSLRRSVLRRGPPSDDLARHLLLVNREVVDAAAQLLIAGSHTGSHLLDATPDLFDPVGLFGRHPAEVGGKACYGLSGGVTVGGVPDHNGRGGANEQQNHDASTGARGTSLRVRRLDGKPLTLVVRPSLSAGRFSSGRIFVEPGVRYVTHLYLPSRGTAQNNSADGLPALD